MSITSSLSGHLQLISGQSTGTVIVQDLTANKILASTTVNSRGWFTIENLPQNTRLKVWGFPGSTITQQNWAASIASPPPIYYEALVDTSTLSIGWVYLNGVSTIVSKRAGMLSTVVVADVSVQVKEYLFGQAASVFLPGYTAEFLGHIAPPALFDEELFLGKAVSTGGVARLAGQIANDMASGVVHHSFKGTVNKSAENSVQHFKALTESPAPSISASANWATDDTTWMDVLNAEDGSLAESMQDLSETTDGIAAGAADDFAGFTLSDIGSWAANQLGGQLASLIGGQIFSCVESWIFGQPSNPLAPVLAQISQQLNTIISNQASMLVQLQAIENLLNQQALNNILNSLSTNISTVQSNAASVYAYSNTTAGFSSSQLAQEATYILDPNSGVYCALININNLIMGTSGGLSLIQALFNFSYKSSETAGYQQQFLSNSNFYSYAQTFYHFYTAIQTQGVQLVTQAYNYQQNAGVTNLSTVLTTNPLAASYYNTWLLINDQATSGDYSYIQTQREAYRAAYKNYYSAFEQYMIVSPATALPDDVAVCLIPKVANQSHEIFYSVQLQALVMGTISFAIRNWTSGQGILEAQTVIGDANGWILPAVFAGKWQLPSAAQVTTMLSPANTGTDYNGNYYTYLQAQGFTDDSSYYQVPLFMASTNMAIWLSDSSEIMYDAFTKVEYIISSGNAYPPYDINGVLIDGQAKSRSWRLPLFPSGFNSVSDTDKKAAPVNEQNAGGVVPFPVFHWTEWQGNFPKVVSLQSNTSLNLSWCSSSAYRFTDQSNTPSAFPLNQVFGGMLFVFPPST